MKNKILLYDLSGKNNIRFSPPCWNVKLCLIHNNIDFDTIPIRFTEKTKISFSNQTLVPNGAAGSPAYSFMDSRNTGMYRHGSDELGFSTGGNTLFSFLQKS